MLGLLLDENLDQRILRGLLLNLPDTEYSIVQESSLAGAPDSSLLQWAAENRFVLVTHDRRTMLKTVRQRMRAGLTTAGLVVIRKEVPLARVVQDMVLLLQCCSEADLENQVVFIPL